MRARAFSALAIVLALWAAPVAAQEANEGDAPPVTQPPGTQPIPAAPDGGPTAERLPPAGEPRAPESIPPAPESYAAASTEPEVPPPPTTVVQAHDDERPPVARPVEPRRRGRVAPAAQPETPVAELASPVPPPPDPYEGRRYPIEAAQRPLTLAGGVWRIDHAVDWNVIAFAAEAPNTLTAGIVNDFELGVAWPWTRDPTVFGTVRVFSSDVIDVGVRAAVRMPAITTGDTVVRASVPVVIRPTSFLRISAALEIDLLLTPQISPWAIIPLQLTANVTPRFFLGAQGSAGWLDGARMTGQVGLFVGHTVSATDRHPIFEIRWTTSYMIELSDFHITAAITFFPRFW